MKDKSRGVKHKRHNNEGKNKQPLSYIERCQKQLSLLNKRFEAGHYYDLEEACDMIDDIKHLEVIVRG